MPIRMVDDPQDPNQGDSGDEGGGGGRSNFPGGGGGGGIFGLLPLLLSLFKGRGILLLLVLGGAAYFLLGRGCGGGGGIVNNITSLATGGFLDPKQFEKANIYEPLAEDNSKNPIPENANLQRFAPPAGDQGHQGSCVAWSSAYAARSILESSRSGQQVSFSPAFLYNQIGLEGCEGSYVQRAMEYMTKQGSIPYQQFPYSDQDCSRQPTQDMIRQASEFKMRGYNRLTKGDRTDEIDLRAVKENLAQGAPVVIGMMVGESFMQDMMGKDVWQPAAGDESMRGMGGHAMCAVGYDDRKYGGSILIMNSWGPQWGNNGFAWIPYKYFNAFVREAYGLEPMTKVGAAANVPLACEIGLVKNDDKQYIPLRVAAGNRFETVSPVKIGTRFKMEVKNSTECYIYVFGKETDGSSYTLFPYPRADNPQQTKYSPFCGITGYRLFPRDKSMAPDSIGTKDMIAVVVSRKPLDWYSINQSLSKSPSSDFGNRLNSALTGQRLDGVKFNNSSKGNIQFAASPNENQVVACLVEISKN